MSRIIFTRSNPINPDSRIEKEMLTLLEEGYHVEGIGWDRTAGENPSFSKSVGEYDVGIIEIPIASQFGVGFKKNLLPLFKFQLRLFKTLWKKRKNIDIVHACDFDTALTSFLFCKMAKKKLVYDIFDYYVDAYSVPQKLRPIIERMDWHIMNHADATIICTEERKQQICGAEPKRLTVVQNSPQDVHYCTEQHGNKVPTIGYFGILGDGRLIRELVSIVAERSDLRLLIGGFGQHEQWIRKVTSQCQNIEFFGKIPYAEVIAKERQCDILTAIYDPAFPNHKYAAPNKFYESLMLGKPVLMCRGTGMSSIVEENSIGVLIEEYSQNGLNKGIDELLKQKDKWKTMGEVGRKLYAEKYSWKASAENLISIYRQIG